MRLFVTHIQFVTFLFIPPGTPIEISSSSSFLRQGQSDHTYGNLEHPIKNDH